MNHSPISETGDTPASAAAFPNSSTPTPGVQETPVSPTPDLQLAPVPGSPTTTIVVAKQVLSSLPKTVGLQPRQRLALQALAAGQGPHIAAQVAGVSAVTVYRWRKYDARFIAAWNAWEAESQQTARNCLVAANEFAARTVLRAIQSGHVPASLAVLRGMGTLTPHQPGPDLTSKVEVKLGGKLLASKRQRVRKRKYRDSIRDEDYTATQLTELTAKSESDQRLLRKQFSRIPEVTPLAQPVTPEVHGVAVQIQTAANPTLRPFKGLCALTITRTPADPKPLARRIAQFQEMPMGIIRKLLASMPYNLVNGAPPDQAERFARDLESLGATVEVRPCYELIK